MNQNAKAALDLRLAKGEISIEEYQRILEVLRGSPLVQTLEPKNAVREVAPVALSPSRSDYAITTRAERLEGIGGWLLFACISIAIISPILNLFYSLASFGLFKSSDHPLHFLAGVVNLALAIAALVAGIRLWGRRPGAVGFVRQLLWIVLSWRAAVLFVQFAADASPEAFVPLVMMLIATAVPGLCWLLYFYRSLRVRNTFPESFPTGATEAAAPIAQKAAPSGSGAKRSAGVATAEPITATALGVDFDPETKKKVEAMQAALRPKPLF